MSSEFYKDKKLKDIIENRQLFQSYPMCILNEDGYYNKYEGKEGGIRAIQDVMSILQSIGGSKEEMKDFYEYVDKDDIFNMAMFFSEKAYMFSLKSKED